MNFSEPFALLKSIDKVCTNESDQYNVTKFMAVILLHVVVLKCVEAHFVQFYNNVDNSIDSCNNYDLTCSVVGFFKTF